AVMEAVTTQTAICMSPISGWEIGLLISSGRLKLTVSTDVWFVRVLARPQVVLTELTLSILLDSSFLPGLPPRDPADRILAATARDKGYRIMTRDRQLL